MFQALYLLKGLFCAKKQNTHKKSLQTFQKVSKLNPKMKWGF